MSTKPVDPEQKNVLAIRTEEAKCIIHIWEAKSGNQKDKFKNTVVLVFCDHCFTTDQEVLYSILYENSHWSIRNTVEN